jgi:Flavodoxin
MRAVVVYESMYGNTRLVASAIGDGLSAGFDDVRVVPVAQAGPVILAGADLLVVGGPTHLHGMSSAASRRAAVKAAESPANPLDVEPGALGPGLREWLGALDRCPVKAAAFDTRLRGPAAITGHASKRIASLLRARGLEVVAAPESFLVTRQDRLEPQETTRAREWGIRLAESFAPALAHG